MSRWLIRLAFPALAVLVGLIVFGVRAPDSPPAKTSEPASNEAMPSFEAMVPAPVLPEGPDIVFKWQDDDGSWHYADQPPATGPWYTLTITPGQDARPLTSTTPGPAEEDLASPYAAPFALDSRYPENDS